MTIASRAYRWLINSIRIQVPSYKVQSKKQMAERRGREALERDNQ